MQAFARLFAELDATTSSKAKRAAMVAYFRSAPPEDAAWAVYFLAGGKPRQLVPTRVLRDVALHLSGLPEWLFDECYHAVGDLAETIAYLTGPPGGDTAPATPTSPPSARASPPTVRRNAAGMVHFHEQFIDVHRSGQRARRRRMRSAVSGWVENRRARLGPLRLGRASASGLWIQA